MEPKPDEPTYPCKLCGRRFIKSSLEKHQPVCAKLSKLHRKPFDSGKQRASGSDIPYADIKKAKAEKEKMGGIFPRPQTQWRQRHETFIDAVSSSKKVDYAIKTGTPLPPPPRTAVPSDFEIPQWSGSGEESSSESDDETTETETDDTDSDDYPSPPNIASLEDYVQCEYCGRNFNQRAAERHIPFCRDQQRKNGPLKPAGKPPNARPPTMKHREPSPGRGETRGRPETRTSHEDLTTRRKSLDSRAAGQSRQSPSRNTSHSATNPRGAGAPPTPKTRSNSAPRTPSVSRLKAPAKNGHDLPPKTPKTRDERRTSTSRSRRH